MVAAVHAVATGFNGVGRVKHGFTADDATAQRAANSHGECYLHNGLHLRRMRKRPEVQEMWQAHINSEPEGGQRRGRWQQDAKHMHDLYKAWRAEDENQLYKDFLKETEEKEQKQMHNKDGDTELKRACRDNELEVARVLLQKGDIVEGGHDEAFVVACRGGHGHGKMRG